MYLWSKAKLIYLIKFKKIWLKQLKYTFCVSYIQSHLFFVKFFLRGTPHISVQQKGT